MRLFLELEGIRTVARVPAGKKTPGSTTDSRRLFQTRSSGTRGAVSFVLFKQSGCATSDVSGPFLIYPKIVSRTRTSVLCPDDLCDRHFRPQSAYFDDKDVDFIGRVALRGTLHGN